MSSLEDTSLEKELLKNLKEGTGKMKSFVRNESMSRQGRYHTNARRDIDSLELEIEAVDAKREKDYSSLVRKSLLPDLNQASEQSMLPYIHRASKSTRG